MSEGSATVALTHYIYDRASVAQAMRDYDAYLSITVMRQDEEETVVRFASGEDGGAAGAHVVNEFLNYLLDLAVRARLSGNG